MVIEERIVKNIARNMKAARERKKWSQARAAEACDMSDHAYGEIERGKSNPKLNTLLKICRGFEMTLAQLIADPVEEAAC